MSSSLPAQESNLSNLAALLRVRRENGSVESSTLRSILLMDDSEVGLMAADLVAKGYEMEKLHSFHEQYWNEMRRAQDA